MGYFYDGQCYYHEWDEVSYRYTILGGPHDTWEDCCAAGCPESCCADCVCTSGGGQTLQVDCDWLMSKTSYCGSEYACGENTCNYVETTDKCGNINWQAWPCTCQPGQTGGDYVQYELSANNCTH